MVDYTVLKETVIKGGAPAVPDMVRALLEAGETPERIIDVGLLPAMDIVGEKFKRNEYFVPQVLFAARAMKAGMDVVKPLLISDESGQKRATIVIGTARGDQHDIGKNLVAMMLESAGFKVIDLGTDVSAEKFVTAAREQQAHLLSMSALMTTTMAEMPLVVEAIRQAGLRDKLKIMIGGAPVTHQYATEIGADGYGENATDAVDLARKLLAAREA
ncbi:corrinoid protein [bacterium]|nr:corrinoid protein [bacterium]